MRLVLVVLFVSFGFGLAAAEEEELEITPQAQVPSVGEVLNQKPGEKDTPPAPAKRDAVDIAADRLIASLSSKKVRSFMWSARVCAVQRQLNFQQRVVSRMRARGYVGLEDMQREVTDLRQVVRTGRARMKADGLTLRGCYERQVIELGHCLRSLESQGTHIGSPWGGGHCSEAPYLAAAMADNQEPILKVEPDPSETSP